MSKAEQNLMHKDTDKILVGKIVAAQGIKGEVRIQTYTENPVDFSDLEIITGAHSCVQGECDSPLQIKFVRAVPNSDVIIARVDGINDRNAAEGLRGTELFIDRDTLPELKPGEYYQADLIGMDVVRAGEIIGRVDAVQNFGAGDILELGNGDMVSFAGADVDIATRKITIK